MSNDTPEHFETLETIHRVLTNSDRVCDLLAYEIDNTKHNIVECSVDTLELASDVIKLQSDVIRKYVELQEKTLDNFNAVVAIVKESDQ